MGFWTAVVPFIPAIAGALGLIGGSSAASNASDINQQGISDAQDIINQA